VTGIHVFGIVEMILQSN